MSDIHRLPHRHLHEGVFVGQHRRVGVAGAVAPDAFDRLEGAALEVGEVGFVVGDAEVEVRRAGHEDDMGLDGGQGLREVAAVAGVVADVAVVPGVELAVEVGGGSRAHAFGPVGAQVGVEVGGAEGGEVEAGAVEVLAQRPAGVDVGEGFLGEQGLGAEAALAQVFGGGFQGAEQAAVEDLVVRGGAAAAGEDEGAFDAVGVQGGPVVGLLGAHGEAVDGGQALDAEAFGEQAALDLDEVGVGDQSGPVRRVGGARGQAVAEHVGDDDEPARGVEDPVGPDEDFHVGVGGAVGAGVEDHVALGGVERAMGLPDHAAVADDAVLDRKVAGAEDAFGLGPGGHSTPFKHVLF